LRIHSSCSCRGACSQHYSIMSATL
jgi:hypothetical protein